MNEFENGSRRPDPEALLALAEREDRKRRRGRLRVFFGAAPGVGKTYAMLTEGFTQQAEGRDVLAGVVETHGRGETEALLAGLELLPRMQVEYKGHQLSEFDLDGTLARRPALVLVDELAHTNAPGSRHEKRWQDVLELLDHNIDVYTTLNVQHVESISDVVAQITGIPVRETVPDLVLEQAEELVLVDLTPDDLLKRLREGKVYIPRQAEAAEKNFFRTGNITALRELALRVVADRVNTEVCVYRQGQAIEVTWPTSGKVLVCVGPSPTSARLVRAAKRMAASQHAQWIAAYVETQPLSPSDPRHNQVVQNLRLAEQLGAEVVALSGRSIPDEIIRLARTRNVSTIVIGKPVRPKLLDTLLGSPVDELIRKSAEIDVQVIRGDDPARGEAAGSKAGRRETPAPDLRGYAWSVAAMAACSAICFAMDPFFELANLIMVYLLGVMYIASRHGQGPGILASALGILCFDVFFVPPRFSLAVSDTQYLFTFTIMFIVALVMSRLTAQVRQQAETARAREARTQVMLALSRELAASRGTEKLLFIAIEHISELFRCRALAFLPDMEGRLREHVGDKEAFRVSHKGESVAAWVYANGRPAGLGTSTLPTSGALYVPFLGLKGTLGVLGLRPETEGALFSPEQTHMIETLARQVALALEVERLETESLHAQMEAETERLKTSLLSSVTHDLQTPLAAIMGSADSLAAVGETLGWEQRRTLAVNIYDEAERLSRLIANLLRMTKLESGTLKPDLQLQSIEEPLGAALRLVEKHLAGRELDVDVPADLPLVEVDGVLVEQLLLNLLENAAKYTPAGSPVSIAARSDAGGVEIAVADRGPGLAAEELEKVFDLFYQGQEAGGAGGGRKGYGIGLAICRAIALVHGGSIRAENREGGGAAFIVTLPAPRRRPAPDASMDKDEEGL
ncbi:MAG TPA: sensor histidine kinase KdpD [Humidesulfovibrio sp.]|uniref:sensor histidine kinase KdpD n=1 Tax=Humidesulfovibrio sp. TaxID=2910988 RepID=UPI002C2E5E25|nr:sensor histidine kinase KdpD [Humidesulfovibrio sp.]HWR05010.1 sensor histidine kinase KdpD [Humidesulfovibrio sp.]